MAEKDAGKAGLVVGSAALVASAIALARSRVALAAPAIPGAPIVLDEATLTLLEAMAQVGVSLEGLARETLNTIRDLSLAVVPNTESITSSRVLIAALNQWYQLPDIVVPDDMILQIKGWPTNAGLIYVGNSRAGATNIERIWPLLANEAIGYRVANANAIFVSGTIAGDFAAYTVEQRGRVS